MHGVLAISSFESFFPLSPLFPLEGDLVLRLLGCFVILHMFERTVLSLITLTLLELLLLSLALPMSFQHDYLLSLTSRQQKVHLRSSLLDEGWSNENILLKSGQMVQYVSHRHETSLSNLHQFNSAPIRTSPLHTWVHFFTAQHTNLASHL